MDSEKLAWAFYAILLFYKHKGKEKLKKKNTYITNSHASMWRYSRYSKYPIHTEI